MCGDGTCGMMLIHSKFIPRPSVSPHPPQQQQKQESIFTQNAFKNGEYMPNDRIVSAFEIIYKCVSFATKKKVWNREPFRWFYNKKTKKKCYHDNDENYKYTQNFNLHSESTNKQKEIK